MITANTRQRRPLVILAGSIIVVAGMKAASSLRVPFFLAVFIAVICTPPLFWLQRKGVPEKAIYELGYELNNRPEWVVIPLRGIQDLMESE